MSVADEQAMEKLVKSDLSKLTMVEQKVFEEFIEKSGLKTIIKTGIKRKHGNTLLIQPIGKKG